MATFARTTPFTPPKPLTSCAACGEPLYAGAPMRSVPGGAMHVGCHLLEMNKRGGRRHLELVVDNVAATAPDAEGAGLEPAA